MSENRKIWLIILWGVLLILASDMGFAVQASASVQGESYAIHAASYRRKSGAVSDMNRFRALGLKAFYQKSEIPGKGTWYRVYIGRFASESETRLLGEDLKVKGALNYYSVQKFDDSSIQPAVTSVAPVGAPKASALQPPKPERVEEKPPEPPVPVQTERNEAEEAKRESEDRTVLPEPLVETRTDVGQPTAVKTYPIPKLSAGDAAAPKNPLFEEALGAIASSDYQRALEILDKIESARADRGELSERISRRLADCYFYLAPLKGNSYFLIAAERYKKVLLEYPDRPENEEGFYRLGLSYENLKFYYEALQAYRLLLVSYPDSVFAAEASFKIGEMLHRVGRFDQAVDHLKSWMRLYPGDVRAKTAAFLIADSFYQLGQAVNAENRYREAMLQWPNHEDLSLDLLLNMGTHHFRNRRYADAAHVFCMAASVHPEDARIRESLYTLGKILQEAGRPAGALAMLGLLREAYPKTSDQASQLLADMGILNPGIRAYGFPGADAYLNPVKTYDVLIAKSGAGEQAAALMSKKAEALRKTGGLSKCVDVYSELLERYPAGPHEEESRYQLKTVSQKLVQQYFHKEEHRAAADLYFKTYGRGLIRFESQDMKIGLMLGTSLLSIGLPQAAKNIYVQLQNLCWNASCSSRILLGSAMADVADGREQDALDSLRALVADPVGLTADQVKEARILAADLLFDLKQYSEAANFYGALFDDGGKTPDDALYLKYAASLKHAKKIDASCEAYQRIVRNLRKDEAPGNQWVQAYAGFGECRYLQKRYTDGIAAFEKALMHADAKDRPWILYQLVFGAVQANDKDAAEKRLAELEQSGEFWAQAAKSMIEERRWRETNQLYLQ